MAAHEQVQGFLRFFAGKRDGTISELASLFEEVKDLRCVRSALHRARLAPLPAAAVSTHAAALCPCISGAVPPRQSVCVAALQLHAAMAWCLPRGHLVSPLRHPTPCCVPPPRRVRLARRMMEDMYSRDEVEALLDSLVGAVQDTSRRDLEKTALMAALVVEQIIHQAKREGVEVEVDMSKTEDESLLADVGKVRTDEIGKVDEGMRRGVKLVRMCVSMVSCMPRVCACCDMAAVP